jgi:phage/plasmid-like protein (TIGR03299 family)
MMYHGDVPWHGLGSRLDAPATAREAIAAAGLDYNVTLADLTTRSGSPVLSRKAVIRLDSNDVLGVVGNSYVPIQNRECFSFLDAVVADGGLRYHTAGALRKGEKIWLLAKLPGQIRVRFSEDVTEKYLLLSNSHDGSSALRVHYTAIRVVCANTLAMADRAGQGEGIAIRHQGDLVSKVRDAQKVLGLATRFFDDLEGQFDLMARHYPKFAQVSDYFKALYPDPAKGNPARAQNVRDELFRLFESGKGQDIPEIKSTT